MTEKQNLARTRNWALFRITGLSLPTGAHITAEEENIMREILSLRDKLKKNWDYNSLKLGYNLKLYKCESCGKRSNRQYILEGKNFCKKHYNIFNN